ncbi:MAG: hypothetical protein WA821_09530 [Anaerolineales bacterium]
MKKNLILALSVLLFAALACSTAGVTGGATQQPGNILYRDDFSNPSSGWPSATDSDGITDYDKGSYRIRVDTVGAGKNGMDRWVHPNQDLKGDVRIEVDATRIAGPDDNDMGVLCRYTKKDDAFNFYYFIITSDGYIGIAKMKDSNPKLISSEKMTQSAAVQKTGANHIRADCIGDQLTLYVNGTQVATATDSEYTGGDIGLIAGTFTTPGVDIHFNNFVVTKP